MKSPFLDPDEDPDSWSEAHSATIERVDLVARAANGAPHFLLMKSQAGGLVSSSTIRDLIGSTMAKSKSKQVAVYDQNGTLVGTVDESKITPTPSATAADGAAAPAKAPAAPTPAKQAKDQTARIAAAATPAPQVQPDAADGPVANAAQEIAKSLAGQRFSLAKSAGDVASRYGALVGSLAPGAQDQLQDAVARSAMRFTYGLGMAEDASVNLAKSVALDMAAAEARKPRPSIESASAALRGVHERPRSVR